MKRVIAIYWALLSITGLHAQTAVTTLLDSLTNCYNREDYLAFYNFGSDMWKKNHDTAGIKGWLGWMRGQTGIITHAAHIRPEGNYQLVRWDGTLKTTAFMLQLASNGRFDDFGFNAYKEPATPEQLKSIATDNPLKTTLDSAVQRIAGAFVTYNRPVGLSIGLVSKGKTYTYNYGSISKDKQQLPTSSTPYEIGSIFKTFTSLLLAKAVAEHRVSMDDDVRKYVGAGYDNLQYDGHPLRLVDLADYTSGLPPVQILRPFDESTPEAAGNFFKQYSIADFLEDIRKVKLDTVPGVRYSYSTAGFNLLAYILSTTYRKPFPELLQTKVLQPLGMYHSALYLPPLQDALRPDGYNAKRERQPDIYGPVDSLDLLHSTTADMLRYLQYQIAERDTAVRLTHRQFSDAPHNEAGLGWFLYQTPDGKAIGKGGNSVHMSCRAWATPARGTAVIVLANCNQMDWGSLVEDLSGLLNKQ